MKILLVGMNFYNYEVMIKKEMELQGHEIELISDVPDNYTIIDKLCGKRITKRCVKRYQENFLKRSVGKKYELILVIVGRFLTESFLKDLKEKNTNARFVLYLWDDVTRVDNYEEVKKYYDVVFSFDPVDCKVNGFKFLPLFYTNEYEPDARCKEYDIYSAVSEHSDRIKIIKHIVSQNINRKLTFFVNMGKYGYLKKKITDILKKKENISEIEYIPCPISKKVNIEYMKSSKSILDIQFASQNGLTIRSIEALACKIKLITTNTTVKFYDFYHPNNIFILDRDNPQINWEFLELPYIDLPREIYDKYSLSAWVKTILEEREEDFFAEGKTFADL